MMVLLALLGIGVLAYLAMAEKRSPEVVWQETGTMDYTQLPEETWQDLYFYATEGTWGK